MDHLRRLIDHLAWADHRALEAIRSSSVDPKAVELFAHVLAAEHVWFVRLTGQPTRMSVWPSFDAAECERVAAENRNQLTGYVAALRPDQLGTSVTYTNSAGQTFTTSVEDILLHVCLHGAYHRGQIAALIRAGGQPPAPTDYIAFIRGAPAATHSFAPRAP